MRGIRTVDPVRPARTGRHDGLAFTLWLPEGAAPPAAGVVVVHGAGSAKESHYDFARALLALGIAALTFDQRGHGESDGELGQRAVTDVVAMANLLRTALSETAAVGLRGSSLGGYLALRAAGPARAQAVVAICPASASGLRRARERLPELSWRVNAAGFTTVLDEADLTETTAAITGPVLLLHAEGDEQVPIQHSRELAAVLTVDGSRLIEVPGGHHRSIQHDDELQAVSLRFLARSLQWHAP